MQTVVATSPRSVAQTRKRGRPTKHQPGILMFLDLYLEQCVDTFDIPTRRWTVRLPTIEGFSLYLGVHRDTLYRWAKKYPDHKYVLDRLMRIQFIRLLNGGLCGRYNAKMVILLLTRNHWKRLTWSRN